LVSGLAASAGAAGKTVMQAKRPAVRVARAEDIDGRPDVVGMRGSKGLMTA
jgi:hypothetical protein